MVNGRNDDGFNWVNIHINCKNSRWQDLTMGYKSSWDWLVYKWSWNKIIEKFNKDEIKKNKVKKNKISKDKTKAARWERKIKKWVR